MRVLLVGNYEPDRQESMNRFCKLLQSGLSRAGVEVTVVRPPVRCGGSGRLLKKWCGYVDKFVLFRSELKRACKQVDLVHVCDHSNAMYTAWTGATPAVVTCHDLLAVRGALGEETDCPASTTGKLLQRWIVRGLKRARAVVSDSSATHQDFERIIRKGSSLPRSSVVGLCLNYPFRRLDPAEAQKRIDLKNLNPDEPFLLHVGSSLRRKNRETVLRTLALMSPGQCKRAVFAGAPLNNAQRALASQLGVADRIVEILKPDDALLEALYNCAHCLVFPSRFEGFGWPILEAQASGCPVICGNSSSLPEVAGEGAILGNPDSAEELAAAICELDNAARRENLVQAGFRNIERFTQSKMIDAYLEIYRQALTK